MYTCVNTLCLTVSEGSFCRFKYCISPKVLFSAFKSLSGTSQRNADVNSRPHNSKLAGRYYKESPNSKYYKENQRDVLTKMVTSNPTTSDDTIKDIKTTVFSAGDEINEKNFDAVFLDVCGQSNAFQLGKFYFNHLRKHGIANMGTVRKFFKLCYTYRHLCTDEDRNTVVLLYKELTDKYPLLDQGTYESLACGLSVTDLWKESLDLLKTAGQTEAPPPTMYSAVIEAAFINNEPDLGWKLVAEMTALGKKPNRFVFSTFLSKYNNEGALNKLLTVVCKHGIELTEDVAEIIMKFHSRFSKSPNSAKLTQISSRGVCNNCKKHLEPVTLSTEEFKKLTDKFLNPVLVGRDIFLKSRPGEIDSYMKFLSKTGKVDVVIDGLNVAYAGGARKSSPQVFSKMLRDVVEHFVKKKMKVMVIGRKHMTVWPKVNMDYVFRNSSVFLAENISSDDPFILYGAMHSGLGTMFVSRDMMRGHKFLLKDPSLRHIFNRWQQKHQYCLKYVEQNGNVSFQEPVVYLQDGHESGGYWHVPVKMKSEDKAGMRPHLQHTVQLWLCLQYRTCLPT